MIGICFWNVANSGMWRELHFSDPIFRFNHHSNGLDKNMMSLAEALCFHSYSSQICLMQPVTQALTVPVLSLAHFLANHTSSLQAASYWTGSSPWRYSSAPKMSLSPTHKATKVVHSSFSFLTFLLICRALKGREAQTSVLSLTSVILGKF